MLYTPFTYNTYLDRWLSKYGDIAISWDYHKNPAVSMERKPLHRLSAIEFEQARIAILILQGKPAWHSDQEDEYYTLSDMRKDLLMEMYDKLEAPVIEEIAVKPFPYFVETPWAIEIDGMTMTLESKRSAREMAEWIQYVYFLQELLTTQIAALVKREREEERKRTMDKPVFLTITLEDLITTSSASFVLGSPEAQAALIRDQLNDRILHTIEEAWDLNELRDEELDMLVAINGDRLSIQSNADDSITATSKGVIYIPEGHIRDILPFKIIWPTRFEYDVAHLRMYEYKRSQLSAEDRDMAKNQDE